MLNMCRYKVGCDLPGKYRVVLDSDAWEFGGHGRVRSPNLSGGKHECIIRKGTTVPKFF